MKYIRRIFELQLLQKRCEQLKEVKLNVLMQNALNNGRKKGHSVLLLVPTLKLTKRQSLNCHDNFFLGKILHLVIFSTSTSGQSSGAVHSPPGYYYGYCSLYQSMDKNTPVEAPVYQNGQTSFTAPDYQNVQTLKGGIPYASVHSLGSQTESAYEPLRGSDMQNVYESLNKEGN